MSDMVGYVDCKNLEQAHTGRASNLATVAEVFADGVTLILPGESTPGIKRYPFNAACSFQPGQRVHIAREGGTILVEYPIGGSTSAASI